MIDQELHATGREISAIAQRDPNRSAIIDSDGGSITFGQLEQQVDALASVFAQAGLEPGDVVALLSRNRPEWMVTYEAALRSGVVLLPVNWHLETEDVQYVLNDSGAKALIAESHFLHQAQHAPEAITLRIVIGDAIDGFQTWNSALESGTEPSPQRPRGTQMIYTSGTTGRPKGVRHDPNLQLLLRQQERQWSRCLEWMAIAATRCCAPPRSTTPDPAVFASNGHWAPASPWFSWIDLNPATHLS